MLRLARTALSHLFLKQFILTVYTCLRILSFFNLQVFTPVDKSPSKNSRNSKLPDLAPKPIKPSKGRRIQVRQSPVHGRGVFACQPIAQGEKIIEYTGELIGWEEADERHPHDPEQPNHTFFFQLEDGFVIDGGVGGNSARWINHSCEPNCETREKNNRIFIEALRDITPGEEISYDYNLNLDQKHTKKLKAQYACHCGTSKCRGTMLAPKKR